MVVVDEKSDGQPASAPVVTHFTASERAARGRSARAECPRSSHGSFELAPDRDPVAILEAQAATRVPELVPVRYGRMLVSPFTFYRGAAAVMAHDLASTPRAGLSAQLCGDAHLANVGGYASPERSLVFDLNDFDETLPGPFEWDVKRMAVSFVVAARDNGFTPAEAREAAKASVTAYREAMAGFAAQGTMDIWYASLDEDEIMAAVRGASKATAKAKLTPDRAKMAKLAEKRVTEAAAKAHTRDSLQALSKLGELDDGRYRIVNQPPVVIPLRDLAPELTPDHLNKLIREQFTAYRASLQPDMRHLLGHFEVVDVARKVVGVGSVGTRCFIVLLQGRDASDPLFLQVKEATNSVLEEHLPRSRYRQHGQRVVQGQKLMQATSDIYLGWARGVDVNRHFYWRQLRDMKGSVVIEQMTPLGLILYAQLCGWTMARAHARSGDPVAIAAYLGRSDTFDRAITDFTERYAGQNERDYEEFVTAIKSGRLECVEGI